MRIISENAEIVKCYWLYFHLLGNGSEWLDYELPTPTILKHINKGYYIGWAIDGYFGTAKGQEFLNDIIARFLISFQEEKITRLNFQPSVKNLNSSTAHIHAKVYKLREFSKQLTSLTTKQHIPARADMFADYCFWAIKLYAEDLINASNFIVYETLESWALGQFEHKERSTIRAKCRSVWNWYNSRNFELKQKQHSRTQKQFLEETMATRKSHITKLNISKGERNKGAVINAITGLNADEYKKKNGAWHYKKISVALNLSAKTIGKIIKEYETNT